MLNVECWYYEENNNNVNLSNIMHYTEHWYPSLEPHIESLNWWKKIRILIATKSTSSCKNRTKKLLAFLVSRKMIVGLGKYRFLCLLYLHSAQNVCNVHAWYWATSAGFSFFQWNGIPFDSKKFNISIKFSQIVIQSSKKIYK